MTTPQVVPVTKALTQEMIDAYARASGDFNPIHIDPDFARTTPMGGTIAHGMLVLASIAEMMTAAFGEAWIRTGKLDVRFRAPARPGDTVTAHARATADAAGVLRYAVECVNQNEDVLISGSAEVRVESASG
jgi:3-hydroxybutyryl-CoA dehydratase